MTKKQTKFKNLVEKILDQMPLPVQVMAKPYLPLFLQLDDEKIDKFINEVRNMLADLEE